jgi:hypothetical protein
MTPAHPGRWDDGWMRDQYARLSGADRSLGMNSELLHDPDVSLPPLFVIVRLFLVDGVVETGAWTGKVWWARGSEIHPWRWQEIHRVNPERLPEGESRLTAA